MIQGQAHVTCIGQRWTEKALCLPAALRWTSRCRPALCCSWQQPSCLARSASSPRPSPGAPSPCPHAPASLPPLLSANRRERQPCRGGPSCPEAQRLSGAAPETQPKCGTEKLRADVREAKQHPWGARKRAWMIGMEFSSVQSPYLLFLQAPQSIADVLHVLRG